MAHHNEDVQAMLQTASGTSLLEVIIDIVELSSNVSVLHTLWIHKPHQLQHQPNISKL
jgi:hypothetical protein